MPAVRLIEARWRLSVVVIYLAPIMANYIVVIEPSSYSCQSRHATWCSDVIPFLYRTSWTDRSYVLDYALTSR
ncbi:hypothetical protein J3F84DRAFT_383835 [Trichoderma pleuroticola]